MKYPINRKPVVSGKFYPADADELKRKLFDCFTSCEKLEEYTKTLAIIAPHAGYNFSGEVAASAYSQIDPNFDYETIFILAPSHHTSFHGASIYNIGNYETPLGEVIVNKNVANGLIKNSRHFLYYSEAHNYEHSLEVQLPFLQFWLKKSFTIVPIVIGTHDKTTLKEISDELLPYFNENNLFIISSDFSHFPNYNDAIIADQRMCDAILTKKVSNLLSAVEENKKSHFNNLATSACGLSGIQILLYIIENQAEVKVSKIKYMNSGDSKFGDHSRVVGYLSFAVHTLTEKKDEFVLNKEERHKLLRTSREAIKHKLYSNCNENTEDLYLSDGLKLNCGVFVSLHKKSELRGCIGRFESNEPLYNLCQKMAVAAAFNDHRFSAVTQNEFDDLTIEISVLSPLKKIDSIDKIIIGKHGIFIKQGFNKGTLLPQVATNNNWNVEEFLGYCAKNKAGIGWNGWKTAEIFTFTAIVFSE